MEIALHHFIDIFEDRAVALREFDKVSVLLSGTCAVLPEANFRPLLGPYNPNSKRWATRCKKNTFIELVSKLYGGMGNKDEAIDDSYPAGFLSMTMQPGRNYSLLKNIEWKLAHVVDEAEEEDKQDRAEILPWGKILQRIWAGGAATNFSYKCEYKESTAHKLRTNALMISANKFNVGSKPDFWSKLEPIPFPRVANITENKALIESGTPSFEQDPNKGDAVKNMSDEERGIVLSVMVDRARAIIKDPKAANPPTHKHDAAKEQLREVAGGNGKATATSEEEAYEALCEVVNLYVHPCQLKGMDDHNPNLDLIAKRKDFQVKHGCFCGKKAAKDACRFQVSAITGLLEKHAPLAYAFYKPTSGTFKITAAVQKCLQLAETGVISRARHPCPRDAIFGFVLGSKEAGEPEGTDREASKPQEPDDDQGGTSTAPFPTQRHSTTVKEREDERLAGVAPRAFAVQPSPGYRKSGLGCGALEPMRTDEEEAEMQAEIAARRQARLDRRKEAPPKRKKGKKVSPAKKQKTKKQKTKKRDDESEASLSSSGSDEGSDSSSESEEGEEEMESSSDSGGSTDDDDSDAPDAD